jgi:hypothetical protein
MIRSFIISLMALGVWALGIEIASADDSTLQAVRGQAVSEADTEWKVLFDGVTLSGWRGLKSDTPGRGWKAVDGVLMTTGNAGDLVTVDAYGDFELSIEWNLPRGVNSGILYRVGLDAPETYETGPEYQLLDDRGVPETPVHLSGALYDLVPPAWYVVRPFGEWNESRIVVRGWKIEHWLNGKKVVDIDLASPEGQKLIKSSKFRTMPKFATLTSGHIALQDHGEPASFRNIKIRELSPP